LGWVNAASGEKPRYLEAWTLAEALDVFSVDIPQDGLMKDILTAVGTLEDAEVISDADRILQVVTEPVSDGVDNRSGIWLIPGNSFEISTRLSFKLVSPKCLEGIVIALRPALKLESLDSVVSMTIRLQQQTVGVQADSTFATATSFSLTVIVAIKEFLIWVEYTKSGISCTLTEDKRYDTGLVRRLENLGSPLIAGSVIPAFDNVFDSVDLWSVTVGRTFAGTPYFLVELLLRWTTNGTPFLVGLTYDSRTSTFTGQLLFKSSFPSPAQKVLPSYDQRRDRPGRISDANSTLIADLRESLSLTVVLGFKNRS
jgi:hypothetical protein